MLCESSRQNPMAIRRAQSKRHPELHYPGIRSFRCISGINTSANASLLKKDLAGWSRVSAEKRLQILEELIAAESWDQSLPRWSVGSARHSPFRVLADPSVSTTSAEVLLPSVLMNSRHHSPSQHWNSSSLDRRFC